MADPISEVGPCGVNYDPRHARTIKTSNGKKFWSRYQPTTTSLSLIPHCLCLAEMVATGITGRTRPTKVKKQAASQKRKRDDVDVEQLDEAVAKLVRLEKFILIVIAYSYRILIMALAATSPIFPSPSPRNSG